MARLSFVTAALLLVAAAASAAQGQATPAPAPRLTIDFDKDWRFHKGEPAPPATQGPGGNYPPVDPPSHAFKDDTWRKLNLPHDWSIEGPIDPNAPTNAAGGFFPSGVAWYRKTFTVPPDAKGRKVFIEFDGVMANSDVYINKGHLGHRPNGYVPFRYDLTDYLDYSGPNILAVRTDTSRQPASRWYTGAGIYRHTRLVVQDPVHIEKWGTFVTTTRATPESATIRFRSTVVNTSAAERNISLSIMSPGAAGQNLAPVRLPAQRIQAGGSATFEHELTLSQPRLWSVESPFLYAAAVSVHHGDKTLDQENLRFGVRSFEFKADTGFWLNGKNMKLLGVCLHHDVGALGAAVPASAWDTRLRELKKHGVNAIRAAHAPMPPEFYAACDRLGLLVMDEVFDVWTVGKQTADYHLHFKDWWRRDLEAVMKQNRNHPSIVIWSLGNEIWDILTQNPDPALDQFVGPSRSIDIARNLFLPMRDFAHQLDPSRPVTLAQMRPNVNKTYDNGFADLMDVIGQNYRDAELLAAHRQNRNRKIIGTENYKTRETWLAMRDNPHHSGQFLWAGVDYLGEAGRWPNFTSPSGILDRTNAPKGEALERRAWWAPASEPVVHIVRMQVIPARPGRPDVNMGFADWTPPQPAAPAGESRPQTVNVYSNCEEVELFLNDRSLGVKPKNADDSPRAWQVPFTPGTLRAIARNKGQQVAVNELKTAGAPARIQLVAERDRLPNDSDNVVYVRALITDASGVPNPNATNALKFAVTGAGALVATDNGSVSDHTPFQSPERRAAGGTAIAIVRATADAGPITLNVTGEGLEAGTVTLQAAPGEANR